MLQGHWGCSASCGHPGSSRGSPEAVLPILDIHNRCESTTMGDGGVYYTLPASPTSVVSPQTFPSAGESGQERTAAHRSGRSFREEGTTSAAIGGSGVTGLLQSPVSGPQVNRRLSPGNRSKQSESFCEVSSLQDGNNCFGTDKYPRGRLGLHDRSLRCLPSCTDTPEISALPTFGTVSYGDILFYSPTVRVMHCSECVYPDCGGCSSSPPPEGAEDARLSRRLALPVGGQGVPGSLSPRDPELFGNTGSESQPIQVLSDSQSVIQVFGNVVRHQDRCSSPSRSQDREGFMYSVSRSPRQQPNSSRASKCDRAVQFSCRSSASRQAEITSHSALVEKGLVSGHVDLRRPTVSYSRSSCGSEQLERSRVASKGGSFHSTASVGSSADRCVARGMGSSSGSTSCLRSMVSKGETSSYQRARDGSSTKSLQFVSKRVERAFSPPTFRQFDSGRISEESGGHAVVNFDGLDLGSVSGARSASNSALGTSYSFEEECPGRLSYSSETSCHRVVAGKECVPESVSVGSIPECRLVCHQQECTVGSLCESVSRSGGCGGGRPVVSLGVSGHPLRVSSILPSSPGLSKDKKGKGKTDLSNSSLVAEAVLVHGPTAAVSDARATVASSSRITEPRSASSSVSRSLAPSRLDVICSSLSASGVSESDARRVAQAGRKSTSAVYDAKWSIFTRWCTEQGVDPLNPPLGRLLAFFSYLFDEKRLQFSTLRGYRASITSVLDFQNPLSPFAKLALDKLFVFFRSNRPPAVRSLPTWDLGTVLRGLCKAPFEPMSSADTKHRLLKTLFLLTLASGARRGEIRALVRDGIVFTEDRTTMLIYTDPTFSAKTKSGVSSNDPFIISSLHGHVTPESQDRLLCPRRALRYYLKESRLPVTDMGSNFLFRTLEDTPMQLSTHRHKAFVIEAIRIAYRAMDRPDPTDSFRLHDMRRLSFSIASASGVSLDSILTAGRWRSQNTFTKHYLRSMARVAENLYSLGPLSVPGGVVQPGSHRLG